MKISLKSKKRLILIYKIFIILINILIFFYALGILIFFYAWDSLSQYRCLDEIIFSFFIISFILTSFLMYKFWHKSKILPIIPIISGIIGFLLVEAYLYFN
jgi:hypothetical protein